MVQFVLKIAGCTRETGGAADGNIVTADDHTQLDFSLTLSATVPL